MTTARVPAVAVFGQPITGPDRHGTVWTLTEEEGWWSAPETRRTRIDRSQQDGAHESGSVLAPKTFTLTGVLRGVDNESVMRSRDDLTALADVREGPMRWVDGTGEYEAWVELDAGPKTHLHGDRVVTWTMTLTAPDPARYGRAETRTAILGIAAADGQGWQWPMEYPVDWHLPDSYRQGVGSTIAVANAGNTAWWPVMRLVTTAPNPRITCPETGDWLQINGQLAPGQWIDVDARNRVVLLNGVTSQKWRTTWHGSWLAVPPGVDVTYQFTAAGQDPDASLTVITREGAWI